MAECTFPARRAFHGTETTHDRERNVERIVRSHLQGMSKRVLFILSRGKAAKLGPRRTEQVVEALGGRDRVEVEVADTPAEVPTRKIGRAHV